MKILKKFLLATIIVISALIVAPKIVPGWETAYTTQAVSIKINKKSKTIYEGNTYTLKVTGTKKKVKWSSSNKSVATVSSKGKVTAKKNGTATITAKVGNKKLTSKIKVKLVQFDTTFYTLKEAAKEYRLSEKIKNYKDFNYDLDGDGKKDKITIQKDKKLSKEYDRDYYVFKLNGKKFSEGEFRPEIYIVDLNKKDKTTEVIIFDEGATDNPKDNIFIKKGSKMKRVKNIWGSDLRVNKKGYIIGDAEPVPTLNVYRQYYVYSKGKISTKKLNTNKFKNTNLKVAGNYFYFTTKLSNIDKFSEYFNGSDYKTALKKANIQQIKKGTSFKAIKFINNHSYGENIMNVQLSNGKKGYLCWLRLAG